MVQKLKEKFHFIVLGFLIIIFFRQCSENREITKIKADNIKFHNEMVTRLESNNNKIDSLNTISPEEMTERMQGVMFEFLIYEDDFDHKKISLSEIKNKIEFNEKK